MKDFDDFAQLVDRTTDQDMARIFANVIEQMNRPTLVLAHNKTLAAQLCSEFREFFPENAVEYFVSYYMNPVNRGFFNAVWCYFVCLLWTK